VNPKNAYRAKVRAAKLASKAEAKKRIDELQRDGVPERMRHLNAMENRLAALHLHAGQLINPKNETERLAHRYRLLVHRMIDDVIRSDGHHFDFRDEVEANLLWGRILALEEKKIRRNTAKENAKKPRVRVTRQQLIAFKKDYEKENATERGWKAAACRKFLIDIGTLNARIVD
jgi:hypothetical protein